MAAWRGEVGLTGSGDEGVRGDGEKGRDEGVRGTGCLRRAE